MKIQRSMVLSRWSILAAAAVLLSLTGCASSRGPSTGTAESCASGGCPVALKTSSQPAGTSEPCALMAIIGVLEPEPTYGLGLRNDAGQIGGVIWPFGYSARRDSSGVILFDRSGRALARDGDTVQMGGWIDSNDLVAHPCASPELEVVSHLTPPNP